VKDIRPGVPGSLPDRLVAVNGTLFFTATDGVTGFELWKSDGTEAGTVRVKDIWPGSDGSFPLFVGALVDLNGTLFFAADDGVTGVELWKSDGTEAGTARVKDIVPNPGGSSGPQRLVDVNGTLFFTASDGVTGVELWKSDGTEAGTLRVKDIRSGLDGSLPISLVDMNGTLFFTAHDGVTGFELWKSDGTEAGTLRVKDIWPGLNSAIPRRSST
jgi:ELWxxDGT repeat protein